MKTFFCTLSFLLFLGTGVFSQEVIRLYDGPAPGSEDWNYKEIQYRSQGNQKLMVRNVVDPTLEVYRPVGSTNTGTAVIVCPGGAFVWLSYQNEGTEVAQWLADKGITAFVLKYRLYQTPEDSEEMNQFTRDLFRWLNQRDSVDDDRLVSGSVDLYQSWIDAGLSAELHIYSKGGHGFGMDQRGMPVDSWIERFHDWLKATGF